jgi:hypothetical protein
LKENFDRFNFAIYKEKEMVDFRRWIVAAAAVTLFAGLASAQVPNGGGTGSLACSASVAVPPQLRTEGLTELIGDIVLTCTGGASIPNGATIPTANITVSLGTNVTSRILQTGSLNGGPVQNISEALLLIDEPGSGIALPPSLAGLTVGGQGIGPAANQNPCLGPTFTFPIAGAGPGGCPQIATTLTVPGSGGGTIQAMASANGGAPANMYLGLVNANQVAFNGIPILAPVTSGASRVYRMTNIRANVNGLGGGLLNGITQLVASVTISGSTALPVNNPSIIAGFIQPGLSTAFTSNGNTFVQCNSVSLSGVGLLKFSENFGTAFKTRVSPIGVNTNGQTGTPTALQNIPGTIYNGESGFVIPQGTFGSTGGITTSVNQIGLADYGTRLKATFSNIPAGVRLFVSVTNLTALTGATIVPPAGNSSSSFAVLVNGETTVDGNGTVPTLAPTSQVNGTSTAVTEVVQVNGTATAVWEVVNTNPAASETFNFGVWTTFAANQNQGTPAIGTVLVNQSYAPTPGPLTFTASGNPGGGAAASGTLTIPRFADTSTARNLMTIQLCQTLLLFPFVTNLSGFDTGISIANTTTDPIGTAPQAGSCKLTWYDGSGKFPPTGINGTDLTKEATVATGTVAVNLVSTLAPNFTGYMMALCNFQYAHGFAFISDVGTRNFAMGYLALIVNNGGLVRAGAPAAESLGH